MHRVSLQTFKLAFCVNSVITQIIYTHRIFVLQKRDVRVIYKVYPRVSPRNNKNNETAILFEVNTAKLTLLHWHGVIVHIVFHICSKLFALSSENIEHTKLVIYGLKSYLPV